MPNVAIIGVGGVGADVVRQLLSTKLFNIISLSNSKHTISIDPTSTFDATTLLSALPPSSSPAPNTTANGITYSASNPAKLIETLAVQAKATQTSTILIDCTSDLAVTELYPLAISSGLSIVTPNKKGFSSSNSLWEAILAAETSSPTAGLVYLEATVGAGLPIISTLRDLVKTGDEIVKIEGVLSGTLSYIFNEFSTPAGSQLKFSEIVKIAKANGYTEPHPADDLSGSDVARKLTILSRLASTAASSTTLPDLPSFAEGYASLPTKTLIPSALANIASGDEFVQKLAEHDAEFDQMRDEAMKEGKVLRYVGVIDRKAGVVKCGLEKYDFAHPFAASLSGSDNILAFYTTRYSARPLIIQGSGAGNGVTAMGVVADAIKVAERTGLRVHL